MRDITRTLPSKFGSWFEGAASMGSHKRMLISWIICISTDGRAVVGTAAKVMAVTQILYLVELERTRRVYGRRLTEVGCIRIYDMYKWIRSGSAKHGENTKRNNL